MTLFSMRRSGNDTYFPNEGLRAVDAFESRGWKHGFSQAGGQRGMVIYKTALEKRRFNKNLPLTFWPSLLF
jgi:hypothetical protein